MLLIELLHQSISERITLDTLSERDNLFAALDARLQFPSRAEESTSYLVDPRSPLPVRRTTYCLTPSRGTHSYSGLRFTQHKTHRPSCTTSQFLDGKHPIGSQRKPRKSCYPKSNTRDPLNKPTTSVLIGCYYILSLP